MALNGDDQDYKKRILKKYSDLKGELHLVDICRNDSSGLGISLVGNKDLTVMSIFVNAIKEGYPAANSGQIFVGDELLEVNEQSLFGRSHLNVTPIFNAITSKKVKLLLLRSKEFLHHIAVPPASFKVTDQMSTPTIIDRKFHSGDQASKNDHLWSQDKELSKEELRSERLTESSLHDALHTNELSSADDEVFCDSQDTNKCSILLKSSPSRSQKKNLNDDLKTCPILPGKVTKIEIKKDRMPLGCRIVGGIDMSLRRVLVYEIYDGGAAAKDARLKVGDEIIEINEQNVHGLTHTEVIMQLQKVSVSIKLLIARDSSFGSNLAENNHMKIKEKFFSCKEFSVEIVKRPGKSLGISIVPIWRDRGVLVANVIKGDVSEDIDGLLSGDEIVAVNGMPLEHLATTEALLLLKTLMGKLFMEIHRADVGLLSTSSNSSDLFLPYSPSGLFKFGSVTDLKKSKNIIKRALPSCFTNGRK